jgi:hypothetical protein
MATASTAGLLLSSRSQVRILLGARAKQTGQTPHRLPRSTYGLQSRSWSCPLRARFFSVRLTPGSVGVAGHLLAGLLADRVRNHLLTLHAAVACSEMVTTAAGRSRADELAALVPASGWQRLSCADGSKGPRLYDWALIGTTSPGHQLLARRSLAPGEKGELELAYFRCWSPRSVPLPELVAIAGARWAVEDCFAEAKNETGLDHYQVRRYRAWYRHITLSMLAHAFLAVAARSTLARPGGKGELMAVDNVSPRPGHTPRRPS